jgi:hypothetical protein
MTIGTERQKRNTQTGNRNFPISLCWIVLFPGWFLIEEKMEDKTIRYIELYEEQ